MAGITLTQANDMLAKYLAAETAVLGGQSYEIAGRRLTRADLPEIRAGRAEWERKVQSLDSSASGRTRARTIVVR